MVGFRRGQRIVGLKAQHIMKETNQFLGDGIRFIEGEFFDLVEDGSIGDDGNVEGVSDGHR